MHYFSVLPVGAKPPKNVEDCAFLITDNWNDWGKFRTQYLLIIFDKQGTMHRVGDVKIGEFGMTEATPRPSIPTGFDELSETFFFGGTGGGVLRKAIGVGR